MPAKNGSLVASDRTENPNPYAWVSGAKYKDFFSVLPYARPRDSKPSRRGFSFVGRQGALANAAHRANPRQVTACTVQFLKRGDWLNRQVRGLWVHSMSIP